VTADLYCSRRDVTRRIPPGSVTSIAATVLSSLAATDVITYDGHGLETDDEVTVRAADDGSLSAPLVEGTIYFAIRLTNARFKLAATAGGAAIDLTTNAVDMMVIREPLIDDHIEFYSRWADAFLPAHIVPLGRTEAVHPTVRGIVADLVAKRVLNADGKSSAIVDATELASKAQLERFAAGLVLRGAPVPASSNLAVTAPAGSIDPRGWGGRAL
jgi:hypothetical protein